MSGNGQPHRREGQAYWDDTAPIITLPISSSPVAGRSPLDSAMNSPESEEPTHPIFPTTQVGPATMQALDTTLDDAMRTEDDSQTLWNNVPTLPADLPPQPEVIEVRGQSPGPSCMPRAQSQAPSNALVWSNMTVESNVTDEEAQLMPPGRSLSKERVAWRSLAAAIWAGLLPDPYNPNLLDMTPVQNALNDDIDTDTHELQATLTAEMAQSITQLIQAWSTYRLTAPLEMHKDTELPTTDGEFSSLTAIFLTALDCGTAPQDGELAVRGLPPKTWMCLTMATLGAILRGAIRSPSTLRVGKRSLNGMDSFPLHPELDCPLTEGGAIMLMAQQLTGLFASNRNHLDKTYPNSYFDKLTTTLDANMYKIPTATPAQPDAPLMEADKAQAAVTT
ncbi:hypothetical protein EDB83DRAFT_2312723 [Lactarius deliciosus]|nr:hypothetical protein EDB83DRAFT_2312723 [Lactarius deliciosus]